MSTTDKLLKTLYEKKLPKVYRDYDIDTNLSLKRYLQTVTESGFKEIIKGLEGVFDLIDPKNCPDEFFPVLCQNYGLPFYPDIPIVYQRRFIANFGEIVRRKGTFFLLTYLGKAITGFTTVVENLLDENNEDYISIRLFVESALQLNDLPVATETITRYAKEYIPYYIGVAVTYALPSNSLVSNFTIGGAIVVGKTITIKTLSTL